MKKFAAFLAATLAAFLTPIFFGSNDILSSKALANSVQEPPDGGGTSALPVPLGIKTDYRSLREVVSETGDFVGQSDTNKSDTPIYSVSKDMLSNNVQELPIKIKQGYRFLSEPLSETGDFAVQSGTLKEDSALYSGSDNSFTGMTAANNVQSATDVADVELVGIERQKPLYPFSRKAISEMGDFDGQIDTSRAGYPSYISQENYDKLLGEIEKPSARRKWFAEKIRIRGEFRYHNMLNSSDNPRWARDRSGLRLRLHFDTHVYRDWRIHTMTEIKRNIRNYPSDEEFFERFYVEGHLGQVLTTAGWFGYLMADGNIYDSRFTGVRFRYGDQMQYNFAYGETKYTQNTSVVSARYNAYDYALEAGIYNYKMKYEDYGTSDTNTILNLAAEYYSGNFTFGAMYLGAKKEDRSGAKNGYVLALKYMQAKSWVPGSYGAFLRYYDQPRYTYIAHGMDGLGPWMHGFKGWGTGFAYAVGKNLLAGIEYYDLKDKSNGDKGKTTWMYLSYYF